MSDTFGENSVCEKDYLCRMYNSSCEEQPAVVPVYLDWMGEAISGHKDESIISNDIIKLELFLNKRYIQKRKMLNVKVPLKNK